MERFMFKRPQHVDALNASSRLKVFGPALLSSTPDSALQRLVEQAAATAGFPIALVSLVIRDLQFFRASTGLADDLAIACATDRDKSFCQFVANDQKPLVISNASAEPELPQDLIARYGIAAYVGFPVLAGGVCVGSLCVIDGKPREVSQQTFDALEAVSRQVSARLTVLAAQNAPNATSENDPSWLKLAEQQPVFNLLERYARGDLTEQSLQRGLGALAKTIGTE
jgi:GAF domain-containing protein